MQAPAASPAWPGLTLPFRRALFAALEQAAEWRRPSGALPAAPGAASSAPSLWLFVSTIGELNAIEPFLSRLLEELGHPSLTLISDRDTYTEAYLRRHPGAHVALMKGSAREVRALLKARPPLMLLVAEIPCTLHDAPCRFSYATLAAVRAAGAPVMLVNGWLYGYPPHSRMDALERRLFGRDYLRGFDLMTVQTTAVRDTLVAHGADATRVVVTGNIKFDAMNVTDPRSVSSPIAEALRRRRGGPVIVAGSVTETADQRMILEAFAPVLARWPGALLVLAPRHPENRERMEALKAMLGAGGLHHHFRSQHEPDAACAGQLLVLDTMGELRSCYAATTLAFVGTDHNVLEPLAFGKPVFVAGEWNTTYPSYPVYRQLADAGVLHTAGDAAALGAAWVAQLGATAHDESAERARADAVLADARGAVERNIAALRAARPLARLRATPVPSPAAA